MTQNQFPPGWDEQKVRAIIAHYENLSDDDWIREIKRVFGKKDGQPGKQGGQRDVSPSRFPLSWRRKSTR